MEMNTRLQVEHPITEETTGYDLVEWQLRVAAGEKLPASQDRIAQKGHAIEVRLYAENPDKGFLPATGRIEAFHVPTGDGTRVDTGVRSGDEISIHYDPMIAKITAKGTDRREAIAALQRSLAETAVFGLVTNLPLLRGIARHPLFAAGRFDTGFIERELPKLLTRPALSPAALAAAVADEMQSAGGVSTAWQADGWRLGGDGGLSLIAREQDGKEHAVQASGKLAAFKPGRRGALRADIPPRRRAPGDLRRRGLELPARLSLRAEDRPRGRRSGAPTEPHAGPRGGGAREGG
jgi:3-methylcrotonyl-CoA carboxylase alpha subunit